MKLKHIITALVLLTSCKVTDSNITGIYRVKNSQSHGNTSYNRLVVKSNHTFVYEYFDVERLFKAVSDVDSCHFMTMGTWYLANNKIRLESKENLRPDPLVNISKSEVKYEGSEFVFKDILGTVLPFYDAELKRSGQGADNVIQTAIDGYLYKLHSDIKKNDTLVFHYPFNRRWVFVKDDNISTSYVITIFPYYRPDYFKEDYFEVEKNVIKVNGDKFKKVKNKSVKPNNVN